MQKNKRYMPVTTTAVQPAKKTIHPRLSTLLVVFNLPLRHAQIRLFRQAVLQGIENDAEREMFSNEAHTPGGVKRLTTYPLIQFRQHEGYAALFALQAGVPQLEKFVQQFAHARKPQPISWKGRPFALQVVKRERENMFEVKPFNPALRPVPVVYRLHTWLPFSKDNYNWWKENRNLPDSDKTKKLEQLLVSHLCSFIFYTGGHIPRAKIKLRILDKDRLKQVFFKDIGQVAYDIRYTVNLQLPPWIGLGNHPGQGFGWQRPETD